MKKFLLSFLCFLLAVAGGYAEEVTKSVTFSNYTAGTQYADNEKHDLGDGLVIYTTDCHFTSELRIYSSSTYNGYVVSDALPGNITKMTFNAGNKVDKLVVYGSNDGNTWTKVGVVSVTSTSYNDYSLAFSGSYTRFKLDVEGTNQIRLKKMSVTYERSGAIEPPKETVATPVISPASKEFMKGETVNVSITTETEGATIYYTTNGTTPSASNGTKYADSFEVNSTTTVKAIAVKEGCIDSEVASATYTMVDPNAKTGTISFASNAQRISQNTSQQVWSNDKITFTNKGSVGDYVNPVRLYANSSITIECSAGNITQILFDCNSSAYATVLKNSIGDAATVTVSDDKVTVILDGTSNSFEIAKLTAQVRLDALTVTYSAGATKPVAPTLTAGGNFVGFKEIAISCDTEGATIYYTTDESEPTESSEVYVDPFEINTTTTVKAVAINDFGESEVVAATYTRVAASPTITFDGEATFKDDKVVTIKAAEGTTVYYTLNGKTPNNKSDECPKEITLKADATLKVIAYEGEYKSDIVVQEFKLASSGSADSSAGTATLVTDATELKVGDQVVIVASDFDVALSTTQNNNNRGQVAITKEGDNVTLNDEVQVLTLGKLNSNFELYTGSGYLYAASSSSNNLKTQETVNDNGRWKINISDGVASIVAQGNMSRNIMRYNQNSRLFSCYGADNASSQKNISLYKVNTATIESPILNVTSAGWATLYLGYNVVIPEGVTCYVASEINGESVKLVEVTDVLPANTAVIVKAAEGEYTFEVTKETATVESKMKGTTKNEYITEEAYVLADGDDGVALYKVVMNGGVFLNNANKAYLPASALPQTLNAKALKFNFDTTGVEGVKVETEGKKVIYDLSGRRMNEMTQPGVYIVNGKKMMVK